VTGVGCGGTMYGLLAGGHNGGDCLAALAVGLAPQTVEVSLRPERIVARTCPTARVASWVPRSRRLRQLRSYRANLPSAASDCPSASRRARGSGPKRCAGGQARRQDVPRPAHEPLPSNLLQPPPGNMTLN
jgi:hypothetical protein